MKILNLLKSNTCKAIFLIFLIGGCLLLFKFMHNGVLLTLSILLIVAFSTSAMCMARNIKEKIEIAKMEKKPLIALILSILGFSALSTCGLNASSCGVGIGGGLLGLLSPSIVKLLANFGIYALILSLLVQIYSLYNMKCFSGKKNYEIK